MSNKLLSFDVEVARWQPGFCPNCLDDKVVIVDDETNRCELCGKEGPRYKFKNPRSPGSYGLGIICAAAAYRHKGEIHYQRWRADGTGEMTRPQVKAMLEQLAEASAKGYRIVTVNGCWFDWSVMAVESGQFEICSLMNREHIDLLAILTSFNGWSVGLDAMAKGVGHEGKLKEIGGTAVSGAKAPELWASGQDEIVLEYLDIDCESTLYVAEQWERNGWAHFKSRSGRNYKRKVLNHVNLLPSVQWCMDNPYQGNTSWMDSYQTVKERVDVWEAEVYTMLNSDPKDVPF